VNLDFSRIGYDVSKMLYNRLRQVSKKSRKKGKKPIQHELSKTYRKFYKNNFKPKFVAKIALFPIADVQMRNPMCFTQDKCDYTPIGRQLIHATKSETIEKYIGLVNPNANQLAEINKLRKKVGNLAIS